MECPFQPKWSEHSIPAGMECHSFDNLKKYTGGVAILGILFPKWLFPPIKRTTSPQSNSVKLQFPSRHLPDTIKTPSRHHQDAFGIFLKIIKGVTLQSCRNGMLIPFLQEWNGLIPFLQEWSVHSILAGMECSFYSGRNGMLLYHFCRNGMKDWSVTPLIILTL